MEDEKIYYVEWHCLGDSESTHELITATSIPQLFDYYIDLNNVVFFVFEDVTETPVEELERRMLYRGKYSL